MAAEKTLSEWLKETGTTQVALAKMLDCSDVHVSRIANGDARVSIALAIAIFDKTGVRVGPLKDASTHDVAVLKRFHGVAA